MLIVEEDATFAFSLPLTVQKDHQQESMAIMYCHTMTIIFKKKELRKTTILVILLTPKKQK